LKEGKEMKHLLFNDISSFSIIQNIKVAPKQRWKSPNNRIIQNKVKDDRTSSKHEIYKEMLLLVGKSYFWNKLKVNKTLFVFFLALNFLFSLFS
jgi:hypothetical protein